MQVTNAYYEDEVRDGFYISGMMKRAWAASIEVLEEVVRICKKHNIQYFADAGTLLGAIRHKGFVPWDDDLDICMVREEYNRFLEVAEKELSGEYEIYSFHTDSECKEMFARIINRHRISFDKEDLERYHDFPFIVGIDICPLDYIAPDEEEEKTRCYLVRRVNDLMAVNWTETEEEVREVLIQQIEEETGVNIDRNADIRKQMFYLQERLFSLYGREEASELALMPIWAVKEQGNRFRKEYYEKSIEVDFEHTKIAVPAMYDAILHEKYGDYMKLVHNWEYHEYPFYKGQMQNMEERANIKYPEYSFSKEELYEKKRMKKISVKTQTEQMILLLYEAHEAIEKGLKEGNVSSLFELLTSCQNSAIAIGNLIEQSQGEGFVTIGILEKYCEGLYQIYEALLREDSFSVREAYRNLPKILADIKASIEKDIKIRKEIVFCPYKADKWDYLESVWRAAKEDQDCDVYVVPIPYFYKDGLGAMKEMHYEGNEFPEYVPVTAYEEYDFVLRRPDVIFIQNPYDEYNPVLSVHPDYYAKCLKYYTEKLVYIPPFVLDEIDPRDGRAVASMQYFVIMPGVVHADRVIVQSEGMKQSYIDALVKFAGEDTRGIWEEKILGLGSPINDKLQAEKEAYEIPKEWIKMLQKPDGERKKVILYNTGISSIIQSKEKMLVKMQEVFKIFREYQDEIVMLWRPHPQMREAIEPVHPQLWKNYQEIVRQYRTEGFGIYDDTSEFERAIELCDAYYGDTGDIAQRCRVNKKPVMIQSVDYL